MSDKKHQKYLEMLQRWEQGEQYAHSEFMRAICLTQLGRYGQAQDLYQRAAQGFLSARRLWQGPGCPHWPVEAYVLAGQPQPYERVYREVSAYKLDRRRNALVALYAYALLELLADNDNLTIAYVPGLLKYPKYKGMVAIGQTLTAVVHREQTEFDSALAILLETHRGMAQHGELRTTPKGFISLAGMCLSSIALDRGLAVRPESEYLPKDYLTYLQDSKSH